MPYKNPEKQREAMREIMKRYRIRKKKEFHAMKQELEELRKRIENDLVLQTEEK